MELSLRSHVTRRCSIFLLSVRPSFSLPICPIKHSMHAATVTGWYFLTSCQSLIWHLYITSHSSTVLIKHEGVFEKWEGSTTGILANILNRERSIHIRLYFRISLMLLPSTGLPYMQKMNAHKTSDSSSSPYTSSTCSVQQKHDDCFVAVDINQDGSIIL